MHLNDLLTKSVSAPKNLRTKDGSDALVLALHCLMVDAGFVTLDINGKPMKGSSPPAAWRQNPLEWIFAYSRPGAVRHFNLRCSLQEATGRLFIHASEASDEPGAPRRENIQVLGLQLANYVSAERCAGKTWEGVIENQLTLREMFTEFVSVPLWEAAEKTAEWEATASPRPAAAADGAGGKCNAATAGCRVSRRSVVLAVTVAAGGAAAVWAVRHHRETGSYLPESLSSIKLPKFELPNIDLPKVELPAFVTKWTQ